MKIKFNKDYLQVLAAFAGKKDVRYYLNGFHIKPHPDKRGVILTATDGHRLVTIHDEYGSTDDQYILPITSELLAASKKARTRDRRPLNEIQIIDDKAYILFAEEDVIDWFKEEEPDETDRVYHVEYIANIDGIYPNTKGIFKSCKYEPVSTICVNPSYLGSLSKICVNSVIPQLNLMFCGIEKYIVAVGGFNREIVALIMPAKGEPEPIELPDFVCHGGGNGDIESEIDRRSELKGESPDLDPLYEEAVAFVKESRRVSISSIQRKFRVGYNRSAHIVEQMETKGVISVAGHNGAREVLIE